MRFARAFADRVAFLDLTPGEAPAVTGDRAEFIGRNGTLARPAALARGALSGPHRRRARPVRRGAGDGRRSSRGRSAHSSACSARRRDAEAGASPGPALSQPARWSTAALRTARRSGTAARHADRPTPDRAMDLMLNRWLPYQTLACRIWGRSAFYQSSGAFGFRDQLQDVLALLLHARRRLRAHICCAPPSRQFVEGDVQHWWHEPGGEGVRTRFSDDRLWLVLRDAALRRRRPATRRCSTSRCRSSRRVAQPGRARGLRTAVDLGRAASLYEHCVRAIALSLRPARTGCR